MKYKVGDKVVSEEEIRTISRILQNGKVMFKDTEEFDWIPYIRHLTPLEELL